MELKFIEDGGAIVDSSNSRGGEVIVVAEKENPWKMLMSHPANGRMLVVLDFVNNFGFFIFSSGLDAQKYFNDVVKLNLATSSWFSALLVATMAVSGVFAGILADRMLSEWKVSTATHCKFIQLAGF